jgi:hypothetical protein
MHSSGELDPSDNTLARNPFRGAHPPNPSVRSLAAKGQGTDGSESADHALSDSTDAGAAARSIPSGGTDSAGANRGSTVRSAGFVGNVCPYRPGKRAHAMISKNNPRKRKMAAPNSCGYMQPALLPPTSTGTQYVKRNTESPIERAENIPVISP